MPAVSQNQQKAAGMALAAKKGEISPDKLRGAAKQMYDSMTVKQLEEYASVKREGLPEKKKEASLVMQGFMDELEKNAILHRWMLGLKSAFGKATPAQYKRLLKMQNKGIYTKKGYAKMLGQQRAGAQSARSAMKTKALRDKASQFDNILNWVKKNPKKAVAAGVPGAYVAGEIDMPRRRGGITISGA